MRRDTLRFLQLWMHADRNVVVPEGRTVCRIPLRIVCAMHRLHAPKEETEAGKER
jgi:hypothetical protein